MAHVVTIHCLAMFATAESWWLTSCINLSHLGQPVYNRSATLGGNGYTVALARRHKLKAGKVSANELRVALLGTEKGTKHEMAESLATRFPDELALRLPPKRRPWESEDARMDVFDAVGLAVVSKANQLI